MKKLKPVKFLNKSIKILLLGSGELGKELAIAAQRLGVTVIAVDSYANAPAMHVADSFEVINMLDGIELEKIVQKWRPDYIVPEVEALRTTKLIELEKKGHTVIPSAKATDLTMNRDAIRDLASTKLKLKTAKYAYANSEAELKKASTKIGYPNVVKPVMSSSGKGQSLVYSEKDVKKAWKHALKGMRGDTGKIIVEEFIKFESEITLLTVKQIDGPTLFCDPIGHRQERGDYQESWAPAQLSTAQLKKAQRMAKKITDELGGAGIFGVEFFVTKDDIYFSELSPRPHDTGMVTMISQNMNEFELHLKAILGLPITGLKTVSPSASYVVLSSKKGSNLKVRGVFEALKQKDTEVRIFGKETSYKFRRMGVVLSKGKDIKQARRRASKASKAIEIK